MIEGSELQRQSRARVRAERKGDPNWTDLGDGYFALHIQYGGGALIVHLNGSSDVDALREWLDFHWPANNPANT